MKYTLFIFLTTILTACGQANKQQKDNLDNKDSMNKIQTAYQNVAFYEERINYQASIYSSACAFELYVNDIPVYKHVSGIGMSTTIPININILEAGKQTFKVKVIPISKSENEIETKISNNGKLELNIVGVRYRDNGMDRIHEAKSWKLSQQDIDAVIKKDDNDIEYANFEDTFEAKVPYQLKGWKDSKNLKKMNKNKLEQNVINFYEEFASLMDDNNQEEIVNMILVKENEISQSLFFKENDSKEQWNQYTETIENTTFKTEPLENYKLYYYANGKVVALERIDLYNYGESALRGKLIEEGQQYTDNFPLLLHIPKGSDSLEIIR